MKSRMLQLLMVVSARLLCGYVEGAHYGNLDTLTTNLFSTYKPDLRPFIDNSTPTYIYMGIWLSAVQELDEIDQSLTFSAFLHVDWIDHRLQWDLVTYNFTKYFAYPQKYIWIPDLTITNSVETMKELGFDRNNLYVSNDGTVVWLPGGVFKTSCDIDITYYPFDTQICTITFSTLVSRSDEIDLMADPVYATHLDQYSASGTWDLLSFTTVAQGDNQNKARIGFQLELKRKVTYYVISILLPVLFLSLTATLVFALPADSGEKMGTSITVLLAFAVYLTIVSDQMPKTSNNVSILSVYLSVLLGQTALGVIMSVWILNLHFRDDDKQPPGPRTRSIAQRMLRLMCKVPWKDRITPVHSTSSWKDPRESSTVTKPTAPTVYQADHPEDKPFQIKGKSPTPLDSPKSAVPDTSDVMSSGPEMMSWREVAFTFDRFLFYSFSVFLAGSTVIFLIALAAGGNS